jgi:hypothetical protein
MKSSMADGREVYENDVAVRLLQRQGCVDSSGGATRATFGAEECEDASLAATTGSAGARGTEAGKSFKERFWSGSSVDKFSGSGAHTSDDVGGLRHLAVGEDADLQRGGTNQFDGVDGAAGILRGNINDNDFGARFLQLADDGVGWSDGKSNMTEYRTSELRLFQTTF